MTGARIGFFSRLLEDAPPAERYRFALEQIEAAERAGFCSAWVAQHHFGADEGGLPSPFVLLGAAAQRTSTISLGTAVVTLPLDDAIRVAEDAAVVDQLSGGRVQVGVASGGTPTSFPPFGLDAADRHARYNDNLAVIRDAVAGRGIRGTEARMYPAGGDLASRLWQATFSAFGARLAGDAGDGLQLSRTQPRALRGQPLYEVQLPIIAAYREALAAYREAQGESAPERILASRTALVVDEADRTRVLELAEPGVRRLAVTMHGADERAPLEEILRLTDTHVGTADEVAASLAEDETLREATDVSFQVHSIAATHELTLRSIELLATEVAPRLGLRTGAATDLHGTLGHEGVS